MFGTKSGLRKFAAIVSLSLSLTALAGAPASAADDLKTTTSFLVRAFGPVAGERKNIVLFDAVQHGVTLESMIQLKAAGRTLAQQLPAVKFMLADATAPLGTGSTGYLYADKKIKVGLAGKFLFTSAALGVANQPVRYTVYRKLLAAIDQKTGEIAGVTSGAVDYAWVALGLYAYQEYTLTNLVVKKMISLEQADGGFPAWEPTASNVDGTGLVLQALNLKPVKVSTADQKARVAASKLAVAYLISTRNADKVHWDSDGAPSVNATAYAAMGLKAAGKKITSYSTWLKSQIAPTGGFTSSYSNGAGDVFATSQAIVPALGLSYLDLK